MQTLGMGKTLVTESIGELNVLATRPAARLVMVSAGIGAAIVVTIGVPLAVAVKLELRTRRTQHAYQPPFACERSARERTDRLPRAA